MRSKTIKVRGIKVRYDLPERKGRFSIWWEKNSVEVWFYVCLIPGLILYGYAFYRLFFAR